MSDRASTHNHLGVSPADRHVLNQEQSQKIIAACTTKAHEIQCPINIAITDPSGLLVAFQRMDSAFPASIDIAIKKAKTVSGFNGAFATADLYKITQPGESLYGIQETNGGLVVFGGGIPVVIDGVFVGSIGISGGTVEQDIEVATAGAKAVGGYAGS